MIENVVNNPRVPSAGTIWAWGSSTLPYGWLLCDGSAVSRTTYKALFQAIGTNYGSGDGSTTFNLPNGRIPVGNAPIKGNGKTIGLYNTEKNFTLARGNPSGTSCTVFTDSFDQNVGHVGTGIMSSLTVNKGAGLTTDSSKSGLVLDASNQSRAIIKY